MSQKVCIGTKWPIFMVHQKKSRILEKTCQSVQKMLKLFKRVHTDLELCIAVLNSVGPLCNGQLKSTENTEISVFRYFRFGIVRKYRTETF